MSSSCSHLYLHVVWTTKRREPLLTGATRDLAYRLAQQECRELDCAPLAVGGMPDHVHLLVRLRATVPIATLMHQVKGASSRRVGLHLPHFEWQEAYGAFTVSRGHVSRVQSYVERQEERHRAGNLWPAAALAEAPEGPEDAGGAAPGGVTESSFDCGVRSADLLLNNRGFQPVAATLEE